MRRAAFACGLILALAACAPSGTRSDAGPGIVFFSVSHDRYPATSAAELLIYFDDRGMRGSASSHPPTGGSPFDDSYGRLFTRTFPAGKYQLDTWMIVGGMGKRIRPADKAAPLSFTVQAGKAVYLGNLHGVLQPDGRGDYANGGIAGGHPEVRDRAARDVALFEKRHPEHKGNVVVELLPQGRWPARTN